MLNLNIALGVASAATQIEGGPLGHTWNDWYKKGHIKDGANPAKANDHRNRWREDIDLMASMGIKHYRFSIEWARLEPSPAAFDKDETTWYRGLIIYMKGKGIRPLLTLHHFTVPMWFEKRGGFANPENIPTFLRFVEYAVKNFGDLVSEYVTINEPNVFATMGYFQGIFPPGQWSMLLACRVMSVLASCHMEAYELIHQVREDLGFVDTKVGFAHHARVFAPKDKKNLWHKISAKLVDYLFQSALTKACVSGWFDPPFRNYSELREGVYADFWGLNYYTRSAVSGLGDGVFDNVPVNDLGWEIFPEGIVQCAKELYDLIQMPIYITENGTCDNSDTFRCRYLYEHLQALAQSGLPVERYYHWCFTDNFEWCEGESARFGLVHVNYDTQKRTLKNSGQFYSEMITHGGVTEDMFSQYVQRAQYHD